MSIKIELPFEERDRDDLVTGLFISVIKAFWDRNVDAAYATGEIDDGALTHAQKHAVMCLSLDEIAKCMPVRLAQRLQEQRERLATELLGHIEN